MRSSRVRELGWRETELSRALHAGRVVRPKKGWLALPNADPVILNAIRRGAIITCVTQAKRLGLWVLEASEAHWAAPHAHARPLAEDGVMHWGRPLIPRVPFSIEDSIENALGYVAACQPAEAAKVIWESALNQQLIYRSSFERLPLSGNARELLKSCDLQADSGLETLVRDRLRRVTRVRIVPQALIWGHRVDLLLGERLVVQIDGGHHVGAQRTSDIRHDAELLAHGYHVIRMGYAQIMDDWPALQALVMGAIAQGLHLRTR